MALSLPYPNVTFVPLDVLTADELNQIVANYTFISNAFPVAAGNIAAGAVTTAAIADSAVTKGKVDFIEVRSGDPGAGTAVADNIMLTFAY